MAARREILEAVPWPAAKSGLSAGALTGMLYPLNPRGMTNLNATAMRTRMQTVGVGNMRLCIYTYSYTTTGTWTATFVGQTVGNNSGASVFTNPSLTTPITLDFTNNKYMVGVCLPESTGRIYAADYTVNGFGAVKITAPMTAVNTWPTTLDQTLTTPITFMPYIALLTAQAKFFL